MRYFSAGLVPLAAVGLAAAAPAAAQDAPQRFTGMSATVISGYDNENLANPFGTATEGIVYGGQVGYDGRSKRFVYGVEAEATGSTARTCFTLFVATCRQTGRDLYAGVRAGFVAGRVLIYAKGGYSNALTHYAAPPFGTGHNIFDGYRIGGGAEISLNKRIGFKVEYRYSDYGVGGRRHQVVGGLGVRF